MPTVQAEPLLARNRLLILSALLVVILLATNLVGGYGIFIDELYYIACSERPSLGYVDHPPLAPLLLLVSRTFLGDSQLALRILPALAGGAAIFLTGLLAWRLGAGPFGQMLAALCLFCAPIPLIMLGFYSMNAFEVLLWIGASYALVERARTGDRRWWLVFGVVAGLALLNKHTFVLYGVGLAAGMLLTRERKELASGWLWAGVAVAALLVAPNLLWQVQNGWPSLEFYRNADLYKNVKTPVVEVLLQQVMFMNPAGMLVGGAGVAFFLGTARGRPWRHLGLLFVIIFILFVAAQKSRPDRITAAYPLVFAGGAVLWEQWTARRGRRWIRVALPGVLILIGLAGAPLAIPVLPPEQLASYSATLGVVPQIESGEGKASQMPQWMADRFEWKEFVDEIEQVVEAELTSEERARALILVPSYGHAGAVEYFGRGRRLPAVAGTQNTYHLWGPGDSPAEVLISVAYPPEALDDLYEEIEQVGSTSCRYCTPWRNGLGIWVARNPKRPFKDAWERFKHYE